jgi:iron-sulfur cluster assembly protein
MSEVAQENSIYVSAKAKAKVLQLMQDAGVTDDASYFLRVGVVGGGCSGLSYKLDFDNEVKPMDQVFEDNGIKIVTDLKSFLYLVNINHKIIIILNAPLTRGIFFVALNHVGNLQKRMGAVFQWLNRLSSHWLLLNREWACFICTS